MTSVRIGRDDFGAGIHDQHEHRHLEHLRFAPDRRNAQTMPPIPDLRYEFTYLKNIRPHVHVERITEDSTDEKSIELSNDSSSHEVVRVEWGNVLWITFKEQLVSPLVQGALWCVM